MGLSFRQANWFMCKGIAHCHRRRAEGFLNYMPDMEDVGVSLNTFRPPVEDAACGGVHLMQ